MKIFNALTEGWRQTRFDRNIPRFILILKVKLKQMYKYVNIFVLRFSILPPFTFKEMLKVKNQKAVKILPTFPEKVKLQW